MVTLPAATAIAVWLLTSRDWRMAIAWMGIFCAGMALVVLSKLAFIGWGIGIASIDFSGISGHAMRAGAVIPVMAYLGFQGATSRVRYGAVCGGVAIGILISLSRVAVHAHSMSEVIAGTILGTLVGLFFIRLFRAGTRSIIDRWKVVVTVVGLFLMSSSEPAPTHEMLTQVALSLSGRQRPFTRADWVSPRPVAPEVRID